MDAGARTRRCAFTLIDLMMAVAIMALLLVVAIPMLAPTDPVRLIGAATKLSSDIEYAQSVSLADPSDPAMLRVESASSLYFLARRSAPNAPIPHPATGEPYGLVFGTQPGAMFGEVSIEIEGDDEDRVAFDEFGRLAQAEDAWVRLTNESGDLWVRVVAETGSVTIEFDGPPVGKGGAVGVGGSGGMAGVTP